MKGQEPVPNTPAELQQHLIHVYRKKEHTGERMSAHKLAGKIYAMVIRSFGGGISPH
jgi:hypothetical protein